MEHQKHRSYIGRINYSRAFPYHIYKVMRESQKEALILVDKNDGRIVLELPTGTGKTAIGYTFLKALSNAGVVALHYIVPTKTLVEQVKRLHPDVSVVYGRNEHQCLYYPEEEFKADQVPCLTLVHSGKCPHFVNQETGATATQGARPCPYYQQKFEAKRARIVVSTMAFYLFHQLFSNSSGWPEAEGLVIDEAHDMAKVVRSVLSYEITDWHIARAADILEEIDRDAAHSLRVFLKKMIRIIKRRPPRKPTLLEDHEICELIDELDNIDSSALDRKLHAALKAGKIDPVQDRLTLKQLEVIITDLRKYIHYMEFSVPDEDRKPPRGPLNFTYGFYKEEKEGHERAQYRLVIKAHYVAPLIAKILAPRTVAYSATIGDQDVFSFETGIKAPFYSLGSTFSAEKTRLFMPTDTPNLAFKSRSKREPTHVLRTIAKTAKRFSRSGLRSLVVVVSEAERQKFLMLAGEEHLNVVSYGEDGSAKEIAARFRDGFGDALVGTTSQYGQGIDLPLQIAPIIFMLRPGYAKPDDPASQFEQRRFSGGRNWAVQQWRVMLEAMQVRGRNIRSTEDVGVCFFVSQQFRRFLFGSLPAWLQPAYRGDMSLEECVKETTRLLSSKAGKVE